MMEQLLAPVVLRRFMMITSFINAAKNILHPVLEKVDGFRPVDTNDKGLPEQPDHVMNRYRQMDEVGRAEVVCSSSVACTNLGYALEQTLKLLVCLETGKNRTWYGSKGHELQRIFSELSCETQNQLSDIYKKTEAHDILLEEGFGKKPEWDNEHQRVGSDLRSMLQYWHSSRELQGSRYKYVDAGSGTVVQILIPLRTVLFIERVVSSQLAPKLGLQYTPSRFLSTGTTMEQAFSIPHDRKVPTVPTNLTVNRH